MKRITTLLWAFLALTTTTLLAQAPEVLPAKDALQAPENVARELLLSHSALPCYPSREQMEAGGKSDNIIPLVEWLNTTNEDGSVSYTTRFKRNYRFDDKQIILRVEGASGAVSVGVNGVEVGYTSAGRARSEFDLTKKLQENNNTITITVHNNYIAREIEPTGDAPLTFTRATLLTPPRVAIADFVARTTFNKQGDGLLNLSVVMQSFLLNSKEYTIYYELYSPEGTMVANANKTLTTRMLSRDNVTFFARIPEVKSWTPEEPNLYRLVVYTRHENRIKEFTTAHIGFRTIEVTEGTLLLNGEPRELKGTILSYTSEEQTAMELRRLKGEGYNVIFTPRAELDELYTLCDREGMMVCPSAEITTPNKERSTSPSNNPAWKSAYLWRAMATYHATRLHPSVVMFSIAHEAQNGICLYESYLAMKALEDEPRPIIYPSAGGEWNSDL
ncbi:MAG: hypothetical protein J6U53_03100 [Tidjanibacter sp.]|nr:hypothetical protein [Tidjanibacter sp.]